MSAGAGTRAYAEALKLEELMVAAFGPDFREKLLVLPLGVWPLRDAFDECGLKDPRAPAPSSQAYGLWQTMPITHLRHTLGAWSPAEQAAAAARYMAERYPAHEAARAERDARARRWYWTAEQTQELGRRFQEFCEQRRHWPESPAPRSPHGDPLR